MSFKPSSYGSSAICILKVWEYVFREVKWLAHAHMAIKRQIQKSNSGLSLSHSCCATSLPSQILTSVVETSLTNLFHSKENANVITVAVAGYLLASHYT